MTRPLHALPLMLVLVALGVPSTLSWTQTTTSNKKYTNSLLYSLSKKNQSNNHPSLVCNAVTVTAEHDHEENYKDYGLNDDEFENLLKTKIASSPLIHQYSAIFHHAPRCITNWRKRYRGNHTLWKRIFKEERVLKEFLEAVPIIDAVYRFIQEYDTSNHDNEKITIFDLCCGKGYLSMFLSELLPPDKVQRLILVDKAWAMHGATPASHHINWDHIYGNFTTDPTTTTSSSSRKMKSYFETWPIPLHTSKQNLKQKCVHRQLHKRFFSTAPGPIIVLGVHLCGTLSLRAVDLFNNNPNVKFFALKPCCLPTMVHANRDEVFTIGQHSFHSKEVCAAGRWSNKVWYGPPRWHLEDRFHKWSDHLTQGIDIGQETDKNGNKIRTKVKVQYDGGYQNTFIFAERGPVITDAVWDQICKEN